MNKANLMMRALYFCGLLLAVLLFLAFVPAEGRTNVAWLNLAVSLLIYSGYWGKFTILFAPVRKFADAIPTLSSYWVALAMYSVVAVAGMFVFARMELSFSRQLLFHAIFLFAFFLVVASGVWASAWVRKSDEAEGETISRLRDVQSRAASLLTELEIRPDATSAMAVKARGILEDVSFLAGSTSPQALALEREISGLIDEVRALFDDGAPTEKFEPVLNRLLLAIRLRKTL